MEQRNGIQKEDVSPPEEDVLVWPPIGPAVARALGKEANHIEFRLYCSTFKLYFRTGN